MTRLASRFGAANSIRRDRPLTIEELFRTVRLLLVLCVPDSCS